MSDVKMDAALNAESCRERHRTKPDSLWQTGERMNLNLKIVNPLACEDWNREFVSLPGGTFFHSLEWARILAETYHYKPKYMAFYERDKLVDILPFMELKGILRRRRGVSLPFTDYCGHLKGDPGFLRRALDLIIDFARKSGWRTIELRGGDLPDVQASTFFYRHTLDLTGGEEKIMSRFKTSTQRNIRKALRQDVKVSPFNTLESVKVYYDLHCLTRKRHGVPPQPFSFFKNIFNHVISKNKGFVALAEHAGRFVAGAVYFRFGDMAMYKFGASDVAYQQLRPNNIIIWETIRLLSTEGCRELCFGRTEQGNEGLRRFKRGWGTEEAIVKYYKFDLASEQFVTDSHSVNKFHNHVFSKMPLPVLKLLGSLLYGRMG